MSDVRLRELLEERVADVPLVDVVDQAWRGAQRVRRRRVVAAVAAAVVVAVGATALVASGGGDRSSEPPADSPSSSAPHAERAGTYRGLDFWWAPPQAEEADLPVLSGTSLPEEIHLDDVRGPVPAGVRAYAMVEVLDRAWLDEDISQMGGLLVVADDGGVYTLDISRIYATPSGIQEVATVPDSLAPDGRHAFFVQDDHTLAVYDFGTGEWVTVDTGDARARAASWTEDGTTLRVPSESFEPSFALFEPDGTPAGSSTDLTVVPPPRPADSACGPVRSTDGGAAQQYGLGGTIRGGVNLATGTRAVVVAPEVDRPGVVLGFPDDAVGCSSVAGWVDPGTVALESDADGSMRILAWRVGTPDVWRISEIDGLLSTAGTWVTSFASLGLPPAAPEGGSP